MVHSGSVVECLTRDQGAMGTSLEVVTALCSGTQFIYLFIMLINVKMLTIVGIIDCWHYSKTCLKRPLKNRQNKGLKDKW